MWDKNSMAVTALITAAILILCGCGNDKALQGKDLPLIDSYAVTVSNEGEENTQRVKVRVLFDKEIHVRKDAKRDLKILISGKEPDTKTMDYEAVRDVNDTRVLNVEIFALPTAASPGKGSYFALYDGDLSIASASKKGMSKITDKSGRYAVKWKDIACIIPSGLTIDTLYTQKGNEKEGIKARLEARVSAPASVRVITWVQLLRNNTPVMEEGFSGPGYKYKNHGSVPIHAHQFLLYSQKDYSHQIVETLKKFFGASGDYIFSQDGEKFTVEAARAAEGEELEIKVYSGRGP